MWNVPNDSVPGGEAAALQQAVVRGLVGSVEVSVARVLGDYGVLYGGSHLPTSAGTEISSPLVLLAHKTKSGWQVIKPGDAEFCAALKATPDSVLDQDSKAFFINCE